MHHKDVTVIPLGATLPLPSSNLPGNLRSGRSVSLFGLASDGACLAYHVTAITGGLLPHRFTLTQQHDDKSRCYALGGLLSVALAKDHSSRELPGILPCEARTFLPVLKYAATVRPTQNCIIWIRQDPSLQQISSVLLLVFCFFDVHRGSVLSSK